MVKTALRGLTFIGFLLAIAWIYAEPSGYEPWVTAVTCLVALVALFVTAKRQMPTQNQQVGNRAHGIQAGGDININIGSPQDKTDV